jgi:hypothetical protein
MPSPSCQTNILLEERLEDIITRAKKYISMDLNIFNWSYKFESPVV